MGHAEHGNHGHSQQAHGEHEEHHVIPFSILSKVMWALLALTILTVFTAKFVHLGVLSGLVAFSIAGVKAYMVMAYFMGLKYDSKENRMIFSTGFIFLGILFFFCFLDIFTRIASFSTL